MTSQTSALRASEVARLPDAPQVSAEIIPLWAPYERSRYGERRGLHIGGLAGAAGAVGLLLSALLTIDVIAVHEVKPKLAVFDVLQEPKPPPPPPPASPHQNTEPPDQPERLSPVAAPAPMIMVNLAAPVQIEPSPVVHLTTAVPASSSETAIPAPAAPISAVETASDLSSTMISAVPPRYPHESRRKREQGTVVLMVLLAVDGTVADISISRSSGFERLDKAALAAVRKWRWSPTHRNGAPVAVKGLVEIPFVLQDR